MAKRETDQYPFNGHFEMNMSDNYYDDNVNKKKKVFYENDECERGSRDSSELEGLNFNELGELSYGNNDEQSNNNHNFNEVNDVTFKKTKNKKNFVDLSSCINISKLTLQAKVQEGCSSLSFVDEPFKTSLFWKFYQYVFLDDKYTMFVTCRKCHNLYKFTTDCSINGKRVYNSGTKNLKEHLESCKRKFEESNNKEKVATGFLPMPLSVEKLLIKKSVSCVAEDMIPLSTFQGKGHQALMQTCITIGSKYGGVKYTPLSDSLINKNIEATSLEILKKLKALFLKITTFSVSLDHWTVNDIKLLGIKVAYEDNGEIKTRVIHVNQVENQFLEATSLAMNEIIKKFGIQKKIIAATSDNTFDVRRIFMNSDVFCPNVQIIEKIEIIDCISNKINEALEECFGKIYLESSLISLKQLDESIILLISYLKRSGKQNLLKCTIEHQTNIRFDSKFINYNSILSNKKALECDEDETINKYLKSIDFSLLNSITMILELVLKTRLLLSKEFVPTLNLVWPAKLKLLNDLKTNKVDDPRIRNFSSILFNCINEKIEIKVPHKIATYLTPYFRNPTIISPPEREKIKNLIKTKLNELNSNKSSSQQLSSNSSTGDKSTLSFFQEFISREPVSSIEDKDFVDKYDQFIFKKVDFENELLFWYSNRYQFNSLFDLAINYLIIQASSTFFERLFSNTNFSFSKQFDDLHKEKSSLPESIKNLVLIKSNKDLVENLEMQVEDIS